jgi:hypothetical protein
MTSDWSAVNLPDRMFDHAIAIGLGIAVVLAAVGSAILENL